MAHAEYNPPAEKLCPGCQQVKSLADFGKRTSGSRDGRMGKCKQCMNGYHRAKFAADPEKWAAYKADWNQRNLEKLRGYARSWRDGNPEKVQEVRERYTVAHRGLINSRSNARQRANPEAVREVQQRRRARKRAVRCDLTPAQWDAIKGAYQHRCAYCGQKPTKLTQDHIVPISKGGAHTASNVIPACGPCNFRKHTKPAPQFQWSLFHDTGESGH